MNRILLLVLLALVACSHAAEDLADVFGGADNLALFNSATTVTVSRLAPPKKPKREEDFDPRNYLVRSTDPVPTDTVTDLRTIFNDPASYIFDATKGCDPRYGIRFTFQSDGGTLVLNLCLECDIISVYRDGKLAGHGLFDHATPRIVRIVKSLFTKDKTLQSFSP